MIDDENEPRDDGLTPPDYDEYGEEPSHERTSERDRQSPPEREGNSSDSPGESPLG
ncbi:hypothetical protein [Pseudomonas lopnurensis]|uniref:hypothetical protein n=1 Tax=Pseudomonas lopnurensis TaxID=1477517 RepID=UPI00187AE5E9|nr:hypothetical protein [Pseudomonas lopnurensis]MBE7373850.1 hypothetical protein [Pseudomonas lopnurensis]